MIHMDVPWQATRMQSTLHSDTPVKEGPIEQVNIACVPLNYGFERE